VVKKTQRPTKCKRNGANGIWKLQYFKLSLPSERSELQEMERHFFCTFSLAVIAKKSIVGLKNIAEVY